MVSSGPRRLFQWFWCYDFFFFSQLLQYFWYCWQFFFVESGERVFKILEILSSHCCTTLYTITELGEEILVGIIPNSGSQSPKYVTDEVRRELQLNSLIGSFSSSFGLVESSSIGKTSTLYRGWAATRQQETNEGRGTTQERREESSGMEGRLVGLWPTFHVGHYSSIFAVDDFLRTPFSAQLGRIYRL